MQIPLVVELTASVMDQPNVNPNASTTELFTRAVETSIHGT
jgi:hypothetical protein